jgi:hypothetical protein
LATPLFFYFDGLVSGMAHAGVDGFAAASEFGQIGFCKGYLDVVAHHFPSISSFILERKSASRVL